MGDTIAPLRKIVDKYCRKTGHLERGWLYISKCARMHTIIFYILGHLYFEDFHSDGALNILRAALD